MLQILRKKRNYESQFDPPRPPTPLCGFSKNYLLQKGLLSSSK